MTSSEVWSLSDFALTIFPKKNIFFNNNKKCYLSNTFHFLYKQIVSLFVARCFKFYQKVLLNYQQKDMERLAEHADENCTVHQIMAKSVIQVDQSVLIEDIDWLDNLQ